MTPAAPIDRRAALGGLLAAGLLPAALARAAPPALRTPARLTELTARDVLARREVRLIEDLVGRRVVAITFFFTGCSTICPMQSLALAAAQPLLRDVLGRRALFVSISIDWFGDTPRAIEAFARRHAAGPYWHFLKAPPAAVDQLRRGLESYAPSTTDHPPVITIGRPGATRWTRLSGTPPPSMIAREVRAWTA